MFKYIYFFIKKYYISLFFSVILYIFFELYFNSHFIIINKQITLVCLITLVVLGFLVFISVLEGFGSDEW